MPASAEEVAEVLVASGRVVPGLTVEPDGRTRSWWWPLPSAHQRALVASMLEDPAVAAQRESARQLAEAVDGLVRGRLVASGAWPSSRRRNLPEAWTRSLVSADPWLPSWVDPKQAAALAEVLANWARSGAVVGGRARLYLRIHEPDTESAPRRRKKPPWRVELLAQDRDEPSLVVPLSEIWEGHSPFATSVFEELLAGLGRMARLAPELATALDEAAPAEIPIDDRSLVALLRERASLLDNAGIGILLPSWWTRPARLGLRARVRSGRQSSASVASKGGINADSILSFSWEAALGGEILTAAELTALDRAAEAKQSLVRLRGQWVVVDGVQMSRLVEAVGRPGRATGTDLLRAALGLDDLGLPDGLEVVGVEPGPVGWLRELLDEAIHASVAPIPTPAGFNGSLRPYQERGVGWLAFLGRIGLGACLADDMGLGKTAQVIATILADPTAGPTLVVAPVSVLGNWEREIARFAPELAVMVHHGAGRHDHEESFADRVARHDVILTTYSLLARDFQHLESVTWARLVFDEAQQIKNPAAAQTRIAYQLQARRRLALTGTPVENRLSDLWSIMHALNPGLLGSASSFRERFSVPIERDNDPEAAEFLKRVTGPFVLRRLKTDRSIITDLPDKIETVDRCPLTREQATLYQAVVDDLLAGAEESEGIQRRGIVLAGLVRLKQVCNHPAHFLSDGSALPGRSGKLVRTEELLEEILAEGDKVLCFTQFAEWGGMLKPYFERRFGVEALWLHGGVRRKDREVMLDAFSDADGPPVFLLSLKAGGTGLNLTAASHVIHLDRWWNPAVEDQATDRAFRIGQKRTVLVHKLVSTGTVEERIDEMISAKRELAARVVGTGEDWLTGLSTAELRELVTLSDLEVSS